MTIVHHLDASTLMSCSAGSQPEALAAVVAAHLSMCPACRADLSMAHEIGVAVFETLPPEPMTTPAPCASKSAIAVIQPVVQGLPSEVPAHLAGLVGTNLNELNWTVVSHGVAICRVALTDSAGDALRFVKLEPGATATREVLGQVDLCLVLRGSYRAGPAEYRRGDVVELETMQPASIVSDEADGCICLIATDCVRTAVGVSPRHTGGFNARA
jgi:putative transcriptional regulator